MRRVLARISGLCGSFYFIRLCRRWWRTRRVKGFSAVWPAVADQSNTHAEGAAAFRTLVNFLGRRQEDFLRLAQLAFPLSELELFYSAQRGQCLCWFCSAKGLWEKGNIHKIYNAFIVIKFTIIRSYFGNGNLGHRSGRTILPDLIKKEKLWLASFPNLCSKQLHFIFLSIFRGDNEKPDDSLEKVIVNCLRFYDAICRKDRTRWSEKLLYFLFNLLSSQIKDIEKEHVNDNESDTQKDKTKEVKEKDKDKAATVSMSQYRACLRWNIERQIVPIHDTEMRCF